MHKAAWPGPHICAGHGILRTVVRVWPCSRPRKCPRSRTYGGQRRRGEGRSMAFMQVKARMERQERENCKTVDSAYVGSNPTPATTCENGPLAGNSRAGG